MEIDSAAAKTRKVNKKLSGVNDCKALGAHLDAQSLPREAQEPPKSCQNRAQNAKKRCLKTSRFQTRFFHGLEVVFNGFLDDFWKPTTAQIVKTPFLRKPEK